MRNYLSSATIVASLVFVSVQVLTSVALLPTVHGQVVSAKSAAANVAKYRLAVVDISYLFKQHKRFKATMDRMKGEVQTAEGALREERRGIALEEEKLRQFNPGSDDFKRLDEQIAKIKADFNLKASKQRKEFLEKEAKVYYQTHLEISEAVKFYATQNDIGLVVRFNGDVIDPNRREDVLKVINKPVVFQNDIDITGEVEQMLNRSGPVSQTGPENQNARRQIPRRTTPR